MGEVSYSRVESERFGLVIHRGNLDSIDAGYLERVIHENGVDVLIIRIPQERIADTEKLAGLGFPWILADSLVVYRCELDSHRPRELRNRDMEFVQATRDDMDTLHDLVDDIFQGYRNHYFSNPLFRERDILDGYREWAVAQIPDGDHANTICWMGKMNGRVLGFTSVRSDAAERRCERVLGGVRPDSRNTGVYSDFLRFTQNHFRDLGFRWMDTPTQLHNYTVQNVWVKEGFRLHGAHATIHINSLLGKGSRER